jgi:lysozyme family protein
MAKISFEALKSEYADLWASMEIRGSKAADINATAGKILEKKTRYKAVEAVTNVPWYVVGIIHAMESGCNFATHLHNGDSLSRRTWQVPAGRPRAGSPPFQWKDSACDALLMKGLEKITEWSIERICFELERYNGHGYRLYHPNVLSPYLWSGTNHYARGKYVADGKWSGTAVSGQSGALGILKRLMELDPEVQIGKAVETNVATPSDIEEKVDAIAAFPKADGGAPIINVAYNSRSVWAQITAALSIFLGVLTDFAKNGWDWIMWAVGIIPDVYSETKGQVDSAKEMAGWFGANIGKVAVTIAATCIIIAIIRHINDKRKLV